jgi:hypothetical protein
MYSTLNRLNHLSSLATTYILILLALISVASLITLPNVNIGNVEIKDLIMYVQPLTMLTSDKRVVCADGVLKKRISPRSALTSGPI